MSASPLRIDHFLIIFFTFIVMELWICGRSDNIGVCRKEEKQALLCFKNESKIPTNWVDTTDCCSEWDGVVCDNVTGHVVKLRPVANFEVNDVSQGGKLSSCLLELKQLRRLDLSSLSDYFKWSYIPSFIGSFANLQYLDLSNSGFQGIIPHQLGNLSSLHTLRLECATYGGFIKVDTLDWLPSLSNLEYLDLSYVNLSLAHNWLEVIDMLPSLRELYLRGCGLFNLSHPLHHNSSSLQVLDLAGNRFNCVIPRWMFINLNNLVSLDLSQCGFLGSFPHGPWNLTYLSSLDISLNEMNGSLPNQLFGLSYMKSLKLCCNRFHGPLPNGRWNLTSLEALDASSNYLNSDIPDSIYHCPNLEVLRLSGNKLQGIISKSISNLTYLSTLVLSSNMLTGEIPKEIGKLKNLNMFLFSSNKFYGPLPESLGHLSSLTILSFLNNKLEGIVTENHFVNLTKLTDFYASGNRLTLKVRPNWMPPFQLYYLSLSGWNFGHQFPIWLQSQHQIVQVEISNAEIEGEIPKWFWNFSSALEAINLSFNQLRGEIQNISIRLPEGSVGVLVYLDSNQFSGSLPHIPIHIIELDLSNNSFSGDISSFLCHAQNMTYNLRILHLGENGLYGEIPDCWMHWPQLKVINVGENQLIGGVPSSIGLLNNLESLDAHKNMLSGHLPPSLQKCTHLLKVDLGENGFTGKIPRWLGTSFSELKILRLRSNKLFGELPPTFCHLTSLHILDLAINHFFGVIPKCLDNLTAMITIDENKNGMSSSVYGYFQEIALATIKGHEYKYDITILKLLASIDLSSNNFSGEIPIELTNFVGLRSLNLSRNNLTGKIPMETGNMKLLESLDLSKNKLSGKIPSSFSNLFTLSVLNLSYNNLSGKIPSSTQLQGFNVSCYIGNNLCGPPLSQACRVDDGEIPKHENNEGDDDSGEVDWFYVSMAIGFAVGFWVTCGPLFLVRSWRIAYFQFLDNKLNSFFVWVRVLWV